MEGLELLTYNPDPVKSQVMSRAGELRGEGYDASSALEQAWSEARDGDGDDWQEDDEPEFDEVLPRSHRRTSTNPPSEGSAVGAMLLIASIGYFIWCGIKYSQTGTWSWTPWKIISLGRRLAMPIVRVPQGVVTGYPQVIYQAKNPSEESVYLITP